MRTTPLIGRKAWFGPRRLGWGLAPVSPEGWAVVAAGVALAVGVGIWSKHAHWAALIVVLVLVAVVFLKGSSPGGPRARREFDAKRDRGAGG